LVFHAVVDRFARDHGPVVVRRIVTGLSLIAVAPLSPRHGVSDRHASGGVRPTTTNDKGLYIFPYVKSRDIHVRFLSRASKPVAVSNQVVQVCVQLTVNAVLEVGSVSQTVELPSQRC